MSAWKSLALDYLKSSWKPQMLGFAIFSALWVICHIAFHYPQDWWSLLSVVTSTWVGLIIYDLLLKSEKPLVPKPGPTNS